MKTKFAKYAGLLGLVMIVCATTALAGPPLVCHALKIGDASSLPWTGIGWNLTGAETYDVQQLVNDTVTILDGDAAPIVHMETLRRATLYAQKDAQVKKRLLLALLSRSEAAAGKPGAALAEFDLGYLAETYKQFDWAKKSGDNPAREFDGIARIQNALKLRPEDGQMNFGAALATLDVKGTDQVGYAKKAMAAAAGDALLARNLAAHFQGPQTETMAELITRNYGANVAKND